MKYGGGNGTHVNQNTSRRRLLAGVGAAAAAALAGCSGATPFVGKRIEDDQTIDTADATALSVIARVGDVTVRSEDRDDVHVDLVKQSSSVGVDLSKLELTVERAGDRIELATRYAGDSSLLGGEPSMDLTIAVPRSLAVTALSASVGDVLVEDVTGDLSVRASVGDVTLRNVDGTVGVQASTGDVTIESPAAVGDVRADVGDVSVEVPAIDGGATIETSTGDIDAALSADLDAELVAEADVGDVTVDGLSLDDSSRMEHSVTGTLGNGGPTLRVTTDTGDVTLSALSDA